MVYENKELLNEAVIRVLAHNVTIRCVKMNGSGYFGIDNTNLQESRSERVIDTTVDRVDISCKDKGQVIGILLQSATVTRANVHHCDHFMNAGGDNLMIATTTATTSRTKKWSTPTASKHLAATRTC